MLDIMVCLAALLIPSLAASCVLVFTLRPPPSRLNHLLLLALGFPLASGGQAVSYYAWLQIFGTVDLTYLYAEGSVSGLVVASFCFWYRQRKRNAPLATDITAEKPPEHNGWLWAGFGSLSILATLNFLVYAIATPYGGWDAWKTWNIRAKFLFVSGDRLTDILAQLPPSEVPGYPLLLPELVARLWLLGGTHDFTAPIILHALFAVASVGVLTCGVAAVRSWRAGLVAGIVLLATAHFFGKSGAALQYADVPLAVFFLATIILFVIGERWERPRMATVLAGVFAGSAVWTKNEGMLFILAVVIARAVVMIPKIGVTKWLRECLAFTAGLLPVLCVIAHFKTSLTTTVYLLQGGEIGMFDLLLTPARWWQIVTAFAKTFGELGGGVFVLVAAFFLYSRWRTGGAVNVHSEGRLEKRIENKIEINSATTTGWIVCGIMLAGYFFFFAITPADLAWHLNAALPRLVLQTWALSLFCLFAASDIAESPSHAQP